MPDPLLAVAVVGMVATMLVLADAIAGPRPATRPAGRNRLRSRRVPPPPVDLDDQEPPEVARMVDVVDARCADCGYPLNGQPCGCRG